MATVRITRGDLARIPADVFIVPTRGNFGGKGAAHNLIEGLEHHHLFRDEKGTLLVDAVAKFRAADVIGGRVRKLDALNGIESGGPEIICVDVMPGGDMNASEALNSSFSTALEIVERFARSQSKKSLTIAMPALGSGHANLKDEESAATIFRILKEWSHPGIEVLATVVLWSPTSFRRFLPIYLNNWKPAPLAYVLPAEDDTNLSKLDEKTHVDSLVERLAEQNSVLFVGSGLSRNSVPEKPNWTELLVRAWPEGPLGKLAEEENFQDKYGDLLPDFAQMAADQDRGALEEGVAEALSVRALPSVMHFQLLSLPWSAIVTTNYDTLIEDSLRALSLEPEVVTCDVELSKLAMPGAHRVPVVKVHGGLVGKGKLDKGIPGSPRLVLTRDDYDRFFDRHPALGAYLEAKLLTSRGVIVGYSISDPHLRQLFARIGGLAAKSGSRKPHLLAISTGRSVLEDYWLKRGLANIPLDVKKGVEAFRGFIDAVCTRAHERMEKSLISADKPTPDAWRHLAEGLDSKSLGGMVAAIIAAGGSPPPTDVLNMSATTSILAMARLHLSPDQLASLEYRLSEERPGEEE